MGRLCGSRSTSGSRSPAGWAAGRRTPRPCSGRLACFRRSTTPRSRQLAASLGADVPSQLVPGVALGTGAGDVVERRAPLPSHALVIVPQPFALSTADVYREADRLGLPRDELDLAQRRRAVRAGGMPELVNDLEPAALSLRPEIGRALQAVREAGADHAMVSGSGPTVFGLIGGSGAPAMAADVAARLAGRYPGASSAAPVSEEFGAPRGS